MLAVVAAATASFFIFDLGQYVTLESLKANKGRLDDLHARHAVLFVVAYVAIYILQTALSLPGATILTLAGGALFGSLWGTLYVNIGATVGATLAFLVARFLLRDWVQTRLGNHLTTINDGIKKEGAFYLFTVRLIPVFPFFVINLLMGLTAIKARTFYIVSQIGMLLGTVVYVNAGTQLANIDEVSDIGSPGLLLSFAALGITPWIGKWIVGLIKRRKVYARWTRPKKYDRNMVVIGAGVIGLELGSVYKRLGSEVTVVEVLDQITPGMDAEVQKTFQRMLKKQGLDFIMGAAVQKVDATKTKAKVTYKLRKDESEATLDADVVLVATGRTPFTDQLGLEALGVDISPRGQIKTDGHWQTNVKGIYAIGDVIDGPMLAHKAEDEGMACAEVVAGKAGHVNYDVIPGVIYTAPEVASVGKTEDQLKEEGRAYKVGTTISATGVVRPTLFKHLAASQDAVDAVGARAGCHAGLEKAVLVSGSRP